MMPYFVSSPDVASDYIMREYNKLFTIRNLCVNNRCAIPETLINEIFKISLYIKCYVINLEKMLLWSRGFISEPETFYRNIYILSTENDTLECALERFIDNYPNPIRIILYVFYIQKFLNIRIGKAGKILGDSGNYISICSKNKNEQETNKDISEFIANNKFDIISILSKLTTSERW